MVAIYVEFNARFYVSSPLSVSTAAQSLTLMWSERFPVLSAKSQCTSLKSMTAHGTPHGYCLGEVCVDGHGNAGREE